MVWKISVEGYEKNVKCVKIFDNKLHVFGCEFDLFNKNLPLFFYIYANINYKLNLINYIGIYVYSYWHESSALTWAETNFGSLWWYEMGHLGEEDGPGHIVVQCLINLLHFAPKWPVVSLVIRSFSSLQIPTCFFASYCLY